MDKNKEDGKFEIDLNLDDFCTNADVLEIINQYMGYDKSFKGECKKAAPKESLYPQCTFDKFFTTDELAELKKKAKHNIPWDFNSALGDTIKKKYESLYVKLVEVSNMLEASGAIGYLWISTSPEISSIFETASFGLRPDSDYYSDGDCVKGQIPIGYVKSVKCCGVLNSKWRIYKDQSGKVNEILIGVNDTEQKPEHYAVIRLYNFII